MYGTLKLGMKSKEVYILRQLVDLKLAAKYFLNPEPGYTFDEELEEAVKKFQKEMNPNKTPDGVVGFNTWANLFYRARERQKRPGTVSKKDFSTYGKLLGIDPAALKAVIDTEMGDYSGFLTESKRPTILFEANYMYRLLKQKGRRDLNDLLTKHPNVISASWNRKLYKGGEKEWDRLKEARAIDSEIADQSASWGVLQIMGANYKECGCNSIKDFVKRMSKSEFDQFFLGVKFMNSKKISKYLTTTATKPQPDWAGFAERYNGPGYKENKYDTKMAKAYKDLKDSGW